jgi:predicted PurR-regulated permease PerM
MNKLQIGFWAGVVLVLCLFFYLINDILLPFVIGFALAYFLDPVADRLEQWRVPRGLAALIVLFGFLLVLLTIGLAFWPILADQASSFIKNLPQLIDKALNTLLPWVDNLMARVSAMTSGGTGEPSTALAGIADKGGQWALGFLTGILNQGLALFNLLALLFVTPVVAFFLLRDWDHIVARIDSWLPRQHADTVRARAREIDTVLSGYLRGQAIVAIILAAMYAVGWSIVGLHYSLLLAVVGGVLAFLPYVGAAITVTLAVAIGIGQFWPDYFSVGMVFAVYVIVQSLEGNFITPKLVGDRVGLGALWVIFAMMAGGSLLGILGILLAVPVAATLGVLLRAGLKRYKDSQIYSDDQPPPPAPGGSDAGSRTSRGRGGGRASACGSSGTSASSR